MAGSKRRVVAKKHEWLKLHPPKTNLAQIGWPQNKWEIGSWEVGPNKQVGNERLTLHTRDSCEVVPASQKRDRR